MAFLWDTFLKDYGTRIVDWSLRDTLEIFWHYCQDGDKAVAEFTKLKSELSTLRPSRSTTGGGGSE